MEENKQEKPMISIFSSELSAQVWARRIETSAPDAAVAIAERAKERHIPIKDNNNKEEEEESLYTAYCKVFDGRSEQEAADVFRQEAESVATEIQCSSDGSRAKASCDYVVSVDGKEFVFSPQKEGGPAVVLAGRLPTCDVKLADMSNRNVSRVALMLYFCSWTSEVALVEPNGLFGWQMLSRTDKKQPLIASQKGKRHSLVILDWDEGVVLQTGSIKVVLQPRLCVVCMDRPRKVKLECNHFVLCAECEVDRCPICRDPVNKANSRKRKAISIEEVCSYAPSGEERVYKNKK